MGQERKTGQRRTERPGQHPQPASSLPLRSRCQPGRPSGTRPREACPCPVRHHSRPRIVRHHCAIWAQDDQPRDALYPKTLAEPPLQRRVVKRYGQPRHAREILLQGRRQHLLKCLIPLNPVCYCDRVQALFTFRCRRSMAALVCVSTAAPCGGQPPIPDAPRIATCCGLPSQTPPQTLCPAASAADTLQTELG